MTQTFDLKEMGLAPMGNLEMQETDGGFWPVFFILTGVAAGVAAAWDAGSALGAGLADGWNAAVHGQK